MSHPLTVPLDRVVSRASRAGHDLSKAAHAAHAIVSRDVDKGLKHARALSGDLLRQGREVSRSVRGTVGRHPAGALIAVAAVGLAAGWLVKRLITGRSAPSTTATRAPRAKPAARPRRRAATPTAE
ncbi:hypothetical protein ACQQ2N_07065 [Dokdonella sp. MW10]|uniref:hypothetical protein n=1 Tax=Dokdonella sp. MW10 TaxID=2992926 RepID=UPI003F7F6600